ncbi:MAG: AAA family ATPase [Desulfobacteraceae bacterium]|nr:AAA family ATPase [Desulfobacteraceae bacterium]
MKICKLRFKNLNSLYGEWAIDFTSSAYVSDKIFAITGPTGAGKSTILDAISLSLYGRTPRLKTITKNSNEIMSRQTGECFAEISFETKAGRFRCHWSQRKAYQKADGNLLESKHEISDVLSGQILESKKRDVAIKIEKITGMDFDRFTRSMLLAQGGFAAFLQAVPDQRAPLLEQITGTNIYSDISKQVHKQKSDVHNTLELLLAETAGIAILSDEDESSIHKVLCEKQILEKDLGSINEELENSIFWLVRIDTLKNELLQIKVESKNLSKELNAFENDRERLKKAQEAAELESDYAILSSKRELQKFDLHALAEAETKLPDQEKKLELKSTDLKNAEIKLTATKNEQKKELSMVKRVRAMDFQIFEKQSALKNIESDLKKAQNRFLENIKRQQKAISNKASVEKDFSQVEDYLSGNANDAKLVTQLAGINEQIKNFKALTAQISDINAQILKQKKQFESDISQYKKSTKLFNRLKEKHDADKKNRLLKKKKIQNLLGDRLLREYRTEHDNLLREMAYRQKIASLEEERGKLEDSNPCPLCGSLNHPFAKGNLPKTDEIEEKIEKLNHLISNVDQLEKDLKKYESKEKITGQNRVDADKQLVQAKHKKEESNANIARTEKDLKRVLKDQRKLEHIIISNLEPFGISKIPESGIEGLLTTLDTRQKKWQEHQKQKLCSEKKINELIAQIDSIDAMQRGLDISKKETQNKFKTLQSDLEKLMSGRNKFYGQKNPDTEEIQMEERVFKAERSLKSARKSRDDKKQHLNELITRINTLKENTALREPELKRFETDFLKHCKKAEFDDESIFLLSLLSIEKRKNLAQRAAKLDKKKSDIAVRKKDRETRLNQETAKKKTDDPLDHLREKQTQTRESLKIFGEEIGAIKQKLSDNKDANKRLRKKKVLIDQQKKECSRWDALHALIGSADGKKYRNFAQGLTFEVMVSHANRQLEKMTDRYLLVRDEKQPLELNIMDNYQAGEIRSTKNLSGGESFIVSLSLALGLSNMAGRNVRVDSLFLDEGFGTLDEEALETSLEALAGLQQEGKLIGIISHVPALKQRISTQITITKVSGGKSIVEGPGCKDLN